LSLRWWFLFLGLVFHISTNWWSRRCNLLCLCFMFPKKFCDVSISFHAYIQQIIKLTFSYFINCIFRNTSLSSQQRRNERDSVHSAHRTVTPTIVTAGTRSDPILASRSRPVGFGFFQRWDRAPRQANHPA
jgi:hypothetical protein